MPGLAARRKGERTERKAKKLLEAEGFEVVKAGGSLGMFDLIAIGKSRFRLIQIKTNRPPEPRERQDIREFDNYPTLVGTKEIWVWKDYAKGPKITFVE